MRLFGRLNSKKTLYHFARTLILAFFFAGMLHAQQAPKLVVFDNTGKEIDLKGGIKASDAKLLSISVVPFEGLSTDSTYLIKIMEILVSRGTSTIVGMSVTSARIDLSPYALQAGDKIIVRKIISLIRKSSGDAVSPPTQEVSVSVL